MLLAAGTVHALSAGTVSWYANSFVRSRACVDTPGRPSLYSPIDIVSLTRMARPRRLHARLTFTNEKTMSLLPPRNRGMYGGFASYSSDDSAESEREIRSWRDPVPAPSNGRAYAICLVALPYSYSYSYYVWILPILADRPVAVGCS